MSIDIAYQNLSQVLTFGRITTANGALTHQEHVELQNNLQLLYSEAKENQEQKQVTKAEKVE